LAVEFLARGASWHAYSLGRLSHPLITDDAGCKVIATARRPEVLVELSRAGMSTVVLDVNDEESIGDAKIQVEAMTGGKLDILVNNACARRRHLPPPPTC